MKCRNSGLLLLLSLSKGRVDGERFAAMKFACRSSSTSEYSCSSLERGIDKSSFLDGCVGRSVSGLAWLVYLAGWLSVKGGGVEGSSFRVHPSW